MKQIILTTFLLAFVAISQNAFCQGDLEILTSNCPHYDPVEECLTPANGETWIRITVDFTTIPNIENTNWSVHFAVSDPNQYDRIPKSAFSNYGNGIYILKRMYRFPVPNDASAYNFNLYLKSSTNQTITDATKVFIFDICDGNNSNKLESPKVPILKNQHYGNFNQHPNLNQKTLNNFNVYPNPIVSDFTLEYQTLENEKVTFQIFNVDGKSIYKTELRQQNDGFFIKHFNNLKLAKGIYFYKIQSGNIFKSIKVTKL